MSEIAPVVSERDSLDVPAKIRFKELMSDVTYLPKTWEEMQKELGVDRKTLYEWRKDTGLMDALLKERRKRMVATAPRVDDALTQKALDGDIAAIRLWYERMEGSGATGHQSPTINIIIANPAGGQPERITAEVVPASPDPPDGPPQT